MILCPMCDYEGQKEIDRVKKGVKKKQLWGSTFINLMLFPLNLIIGLIYYILPFPLN